MDIKKHVQNLNSVAGDFSLITSTLDRFFRFIKNRNIFILKLTAINNNMHLCLAHYISQQKKNNNPK